MSFFKTVFASAIGTFLALTGMMIFGFFIIAGIIGFLMMGHGQHENKQTVVEDKSILFVNVEGEIAERKGVNDFFKEVFYEQKPKTIGLFELNETVQEAMKDKKIKGLYLRLRYADAGWGKVEALRKILSQFKESGKFIYAYSEVYDEKLYYLATVADEIWMYPEGEFEWNGIFSQSTFFKKTLEKLEVEPTLIRAGKFKSAGEMITQEKMSEENRLQITEITSGLWGHIVRQVAESRKGLSAEQLNQWAQNLSVSSAQSAYNLKLVEQLIPIEEVEKRLLKATGLDEDEDVRLVSWSAYPTKLDKKSFLSKKKKIAVILAEGEILSGSGSENDQIYSDELASLIRDLNKEEDIKAVVLRVNSPGGSALASDVIWRSLEYLKRNKKLVASFSDVAASGGYYIAAGSDYIFAEPTTITGSIGVFGMIFNAQKLFDNKLGVTFDEVKTHESADMMSGVRSLTPFEKTKIQNDVSDIYQTFLSVVKEGRKSFEDVAQVKEVAEGRVWTGAKAKEMGLVDELGSLNDAILKAAALAQVKDYEVVLYPDEKMFFDKILDSLGEVFTLPVWLSRWVKSSQKINGEVYFTRLPFDNQMK